MAIATTSITEVVNNGGGTWKDYGAGGGSASNTVTFITSTGSRARKVSNALKGFAFDLGVGGVDVSGDVIAIKWIVTAGVGSLSARSAGGVRIVMEDTSGNEGYWYMDGNDSYTGGWKLSVIDASQTPSGNNGTNPTMTAIRYIGIIWNVTASVSGGDPNCYIDQILRWPDTGLVITGNSTTLLADLESTIDNPANGPYFIFEQRGGIIFGKAKIDLQPDASDMSDTDRTYVMEDPVWYDGTNVDSALVEIGITCSDADNVTLTRCTVTAAEPDETVTTEANKELDVSGATDFDLDTCTVRGFNGTAAVALGGSGQSITDCNFDQNGLITTTGAVIRDCTFRRATDAAGAFKWEQNSDIDRCAFFSDGTGYGIQYRPTGAGPFTENLDGFTFTGYGAAETANAAVHIFPVTTTVTITWNISNGTAPTYDEDATYTGTFTSNANVTVTFTGMKDNTEVRIYTAGTGTELDGIENATAGSPDNRSFAASVAASTSVDYTLINELYEIIRVEAFTWPASNQNLPIQQRLDRNFSNPA